MTTKGENCKLITVDSPNVRYGEKFIESVCSLMVNNVKVGQGRDIRTNDFHVRPESKQYVLRTATKVPKLGVMLVGMGGNNGSTFCATILANRNKMRWFTKRGEHCANFIGSVSQSATMAIGVDSSTNQEVFAPINRIVPLADPNELEVTGWDISSANLAQAVERAGVLDYDLQCKLRPMLEGTRPLPSAYNPLWIASNQNERADNVLTGTLSEQLERIRADIRTFRSVRGVESCVVIWTANTEKMCSEQQGVHDRWKNLEAAIAANRVEQVSASCLFAVAACLEGCIAFINGSPQNSLVPAVVELARTNDVLLAGDDFKTGQTKLKCVLVDYLVAAGLKLRSIVSYNHLGNNDGKNLSEAEQFHSKEVTKSGVIDDFLRSNPLLFKRDTMHPDQVCREDCVDHAIVIKYIPFVGDSKRALDEYSSEILLAGTNTLVLHNTCEDTLLAVPVMLDLLVFCELLSRVQVSEVTSQAASVADVLRKADSMKFHRLDTLLASTLGYFLKAPCIDPHVPEINSLFRQRAALENFLRACVGLSPMDHMFLERKLRKDACSK